MTIEQIKEQVNDTPRNHQNKRIFSFELKNTILESIKDFKSLSDAAAYYEIAPTLMSRWRKMSEGIIQIRQVPHGKVGIRYSLSTKIQAAEQVLLGGKSLTEVSRTMGMSTVTVGAWIKDYQDGLYSLESVTQISRKKFRSYELIIGQIKKAEENIDNLKREAKESLDREYQNKLKEIA